MAERKATRGIRNYADLFPRHFRPKYQKNRGSWYFTIHQLRLMLLREGVDLDEAVKRARQIYYSLLAHNAKESYSDHKNRSLIVPFAPNELEGMQGLWDEDISAILPPRTPHYQNWKEARMP